MMTKKRSLIPNVITMGNLIIGFFAIVISSKGFRDMNPELIALAGILIFIASFCDMFDGAAARALGVQSEIGGQLDSFADAISYGIAPGVISYHAVLHKLSPIAWGFDWGMIVAAFFPVFAIYRLARFNLGDECKGFTGLPSPAAGIIISSIPALPYSKVLWEHTYYFEIPPVPFIVFFLFVGFLMVSKVDYNKLFSDLYNKGRVVSIITIIVITLLLVFFRMWSVYFVTLIYIIVGLVVFSFKSFIKKRVV